MPKNKSHYLTLILTLDQILFKEILIGGIRIQNGKNNLIKPNPKGIVNILLKSRIINIV